MNRQEKQQEIVEMQEVYSTCDWVFLVNYKGIRVGDVRKMRADIQKSGGTMRVVKNTLNRIAIKNTKFEIIAEHFKDQTAVVYGHDAAELAKIIHDYASKKRKVTVYTYTDGKQVYSHSSLERLATLPSLDVLRAQVLAMLLAPASKLARVLMEPGSRVARLLAMYSTKKLN